MISILLSTMFLIFPQSTRGLSMLARLNTIRCHHLRPQFQPAATRELSMSLSSGKKSTTRKKVSLQRIDKVLADRGVGTRSQTFELAKAKRITMASCPEAAERTRIKGPKEKVPSDATLFLDGNLLPPAAPLLLLYHKPKFVLSAMEDDKKYQERKHLGQMLESRYKRCGMHPVGRLDYDTTGLILFSLDGKLTQRLLHPRRGVEKEYLATVQGAVDEMKLRQLLSDGVETSDGTFSAQLMEVTPHDGPVSFVEDETVLWDEESSSEDRAQADYSGEYSEVRLIVTEGKYRMVRRMLANCGHPVVELKRERHGNITLGNLNVGEFRLPTEGELEWAEALMK